jgi:hypothetical protein
LTINGVGADHSVSLGDLNSEDNAAGQRHIEFNGSLDAQEMPIETSRKFSEISNRSQPGPTLNDSGTLGNINFRCSVRSFQLPSECGAATLVLVSPSYVIQNETGKILRVSQEYATQDFYDLAHKEVYYVTFSFKEKSNLIFGAHDQKLFFNYADEASVWSSGLSMKNLTTGEFFLKIGALNNDTPKILLFSVQLIGNSTLIKIKSASQKSGEIIIRNNTDFTFKIFQKDFDQCNECVMPLSEKYFCWDDPFEKPQLVIQKIFNNKADNISLTLDVKGEYKIYSLYDKIGKGHLQASISKGIINSSSIVININWRKIEKQVYGLQLFQIFPRTVKLTENPDLSSYLPIDPKKFVSKEDGTPNG